MKKAVVIFTLLCLLTVSASAAYIPEDVITENRDGRQLIIKTFQLGPTDDPTALVEEPFELEGYRYEHLETVKEEQPFKDTQQHAETVTVPCNMGSTQAAAVYTLTPASAVYTPFNGEIPIFQQSPSSHRSVT